jgi:hypothetical protein
LIPNKVESFEEFLSSSFEDGVFSRELRLSKEEVTYVQKKYPKASVNKCPGTESSDGKSWYEIHLLPPIATMDNPMNSNGLAAIQNENQQLKQELELLKKSLKDVGIR